MAEFLDPDLQEEMQPEVESDFEEATDKADTLKMIVVCGVDETLLSDLKAKTIEERLERLERENENRVSEIANLAITFRTLLNRFFPKIQAIYSHFFVEEKKK